jgi:TorA maturation chaperone TorD
MNAETESLEIADPIPSVDLARADLYAVLARLFYAAPDAHLLRSLAQAGELVGEGTAGTLATAWEELRHAARLCSAEVVREEYDSVFVGVSASRVSLYALAYMDGAARRPHPLVGLRETLAQFGLARSAQAGEPEDHVAGLADVMRHLIIATDRPPGARQQAQARFFQAFIEPWYERLCDAITASGRCTFYGPVSRVARAFLDLERASLRMGNL